jgi:hypothetical protein
MNQRINQRMNKHNNKPKDLLTTIQTFANRYGEPLVGAFVGLVTGALTAALGGNVVHGVQIAATGVGNLIIALFQTPVPNARSLNGGQQFFVHTRHLTALFLTPFVFVSLVLVVLVVALYSNLLRTRTNGAQKPTK